MNRLLNIVGIVDEEDTPVSQTEDDVPYDGEEEPGTYQEEPHYAKKRGKIVSLPTSNTNRMRMIVYQPKRNEDTQIIIDNLKARKPIIINLDEMDTESAQRVLDFVSGAVYALNGGIKKVARSIFVVAPSNIEITENIGESSEEENHIRSARTLRR